MILSKEQAKAVYDAMCALNDVNGRIKVSFGDVLTEGINVFENSERIVRVVKVHEYSVLDYEDYGDQNAFTTAYGVQP